MTRLLPAFLLLGGCVNNAGEKIAMPWGTIALLVGLLTLVVLWAASGAEDKRRIKDLQDEIRELREEVAAYEEWLASAPGKEDDDGDDES